LLSGPWFLLIDANRRGANDSLRHRAAFFKPGGASFTYRSFQAPVGAVLVARGAEGGRPPGPDPWAAGPVSVKCPLPRHAPTWGWAAQLYAVRSSGSWGVGDLADLRELHRDDPEHDPVDSGHGSDLG